MKISWCVLSPRVSLALLVSVALLLALALTAGWSGAAQAQGPAEWPAITLNRIDLDLSWPVGIANAGDGSNRLFVVERTGRIWILRDNVKAQEPFLDIRDRVRSQHWEQGLLGLAFPPGFADKGYFYVYYTDLGGDSVVARYRLVARDPDTADPASEMVILSVDQPFENHNAGQLAFGPDGYLYVGLGDGGSGGDPLDNAQNPDTLLGKILRVDVEPDSAPMTGTVGMEHRLFLPGISHGSYFTYTIPEDNPFAGVPGHQDEIWALGLRNPWRFSFDAGTGDLFIGDVGQNLYEEVNYQPASSTGGENYGWRIMEGTHCFEAATCDQSGLTLPVAEYSHEFGRCSVTGGEVYRGSGFPVLQGIYFFADFCTGEVWGLRQEGDSWQQTILHDSASRLSSFGSDELGNLYVADYTVGGADLYMIVEAGGE